MFKGKKVGVSTVFFHAFFELHYEKFFYLIFQMHHENVFLWKQLPLFYEKIRHYVDCALSSTRYMHGNMFYWILFWGYQETVAVYVRY